MKWRALMLISLTFSLQVNVDEIKIEPIGRGEASKGRDKSSQRLVNGTQKKAALAGSFKSF